MTGAAGYEVNLEDATTGATVANALAVPSHSYTPTSSLDNLDTYVWTVSAVSDTGTNGTPSASPPSGSVYFTVDIGVAPVAIAPANEATVTSSPTFQWSAVANAVSYNLTIVDESVVPETTSVISVPGTSYSPPNPLAGTYYSWSVQAVVQIGGTTTQSTQSGLSVFWVSGDPQPTMLSPLPGATVTTATPTLEWSYNSTSQYNGGYPRSLRCDNRGGCHRDLGDRSGR